MRKTAALIESLISTGRAQGLRAADVAARAGISEASLSRIRSTGRFNADTLERLLAATGCTVEVRPRRKREADTLALVSAKLNAGRRHRLSPEEIRHLMTRFRPSKKVERAFSHLVGIAEELPIEQVHDLVLEGSATLPALKRIVHYVDGQGPTSDWIKNA